MNSIWIHLGIASWKPFVTALLLPPVPFLVLLFAGASVSGPRRRLGRISLLVATSLVWLSCCDGVGETLLVTLISPPPALTLAEISDLRTHAREPVAIIVLGSGVEDWAPEYADSTLSVRSLERLRFGVWLSRRTGWPIGFSGGAGWGQNVDGAVREATVAQRIASQEFNTPLRWVESESRDTRENAINTVAMLRLAGVRRILLVTHAWHMPRALRDFEAAAGGTIKIEAAPMGMSRSADFSLLRWLPTGDGLNKSRAAVREWLGALAGA